MVKDLSPGEEMDSGHLDRTAPRQFGHQVFDDLFVNSEGGGFAPDAKRAAEGRGARIHADGDSRADSVPSRHTDDPFRLPSGLHVDLPNATFEDEVQLLLGLPGTGKDDPVRLTTGISRPPVLASGRDFEAGALLEKEPQDCRIRIRLDRIEDFVATGKRITQF